MWIYACLDIYMYVCVKLSIFENKLSVYTFKILEVKGVELEPVSRLFWQIQMISEAPPHK